MVTYTNYIGWGRRAWGDGAWNYDYDELTIDGSAISAAIDFLTVDIRNDVQITGVSFQTFGGTVTADIITITDLIGISFGSYLGSTKTFTWIGGNGGGNYTAVPGNSASWSDASAGGGSYLPVNSSNNKAWVDITTGAGDWYDV